MSLQKQSILFVNGLDKSVNENMLYLLFNDFSVSYIKIAKDHDTRESFGYAFIGFKNMNKAEEAMNKLNYSKLAKKTIHISWYNREPENYRSKIENNIFVKKIPKNVTQKEFYDYFNKFGNIISCKIAEDEDGESMGFGFVLYDSEEKAKNAIKECNGQNWHGKKIYVSQFIKNRPKKPLKFNNVYVRNIPKDWSENDVRKYFSKFGEIGSMIVKLPEKDKLSKELPETKMRQILNHKYAFICYKSLDGPAKIVVSKVPFLKISDAKYNTKIEDLAKKLYYYGVQEEDKYRLACYILDNDLEEKINNKENLSKIKESFALLIKENEDYKAKNQDNRLFCCQALKKSERDKKLKLLYEKIKKKIQEKYKFCNLYIKNLPIDYTDEKLQELFGKFGKIRNSKVVKKEFETFYLVPKKVTKVFGFVCFYEPSQAQEAKKNLKDLSLLGNGPKLYIDYHQTKKERASFLKLKFIKISQKQKNIPKIPPSIPYIRQFRAFINFLQMQNNPRAIPNIREFSDKNSNSMDSNARNEYFGEKLYSKIAKMPQFDKYSNYFSKIVGIFLDLDDNVLYKLLNDNQYFVEQINETIKLLTEKEKPT